MSAMSKKIIFINWKWEMRQNPGIPYFPASAKENIYEIEQVTDKNLEEKLPEFMGQVSEGQQIFIRDTVEKGGGQVIRLRIELDALSEENKRKVENGIMTLIKEKIVKKGGEVLFMFHQNQGFDLEHFDSPDKNIQYRTFGGGQEPIYDELLGADYCYLEDFDDRAFAVKENDDDPFIIYQDRFDKVWDHYWYQTKKKMMKLYEKVLVSQIPYYPPKQKEEIVALAKGFTTYYHDLEKYINSDKKAAFFSKVTYFENCENLIKSNLPAIKSDESLSSERQEEIQKQQKQREEAQKKIDDYNQKGGALNQELERFANHPSTDTQNWDTLNEAFHSFMVLL